MSCLEVAEEKIKIKSDLLREVLAEFLGTFVLIVSILYYNMNIQRE